MLITSYINRTQHFELLYLVVFKILIPKVWNFFIESPDIPCSTNFLGRFCQYHHFAWTWKQKEKCFGNNKNILFINSNCKIIEQEMKKISNTYPGHFHGDTRYIFAHFLVYILSYSL